MALTLAPQNITPEPAWEPRFVAYWVFWLVFASVASMLILPAALIVSRNGQRTGAVRQNPGRPLGRDNAERELKGSLKDSAIKNDQERSRTINHSNDPSSDGDGKRRRDDHIARPVRAAVDALRGDQRRDAVRGFATRASATIPTIPLPAVRRQCARRGRGTEVPTEVPHTCAFSCWAIPRYSASSE